jgi:uncharacterized protein (TIGR00297 family)
LIFSTGVLAGARPATVARNAFLTALTITAIFALGGYLLRGVSRSGAVAGFLVAFLLYRYAGAGAFGLLVALFVVTFLATRLGRQRKLALGTAEKPEGRSASQVLANIGVSALFAVIYGYFRHYSLLVACAAALAEAAADTVSSECGQAFSSSARLVTTGARVPAGTNGGISLPGTASGALAALLLSLVAVRGCMIAGSAAPVVCTAALAGLFLDSLLGALVESRGWLNNDAVNLLGTLSAGLLALWWAR